jgi:hypothetical protein
MDMEDVMCPGGVPCPPLTAGTYLVEVLGFRDDVISAYDLRVIIGP